MNNQPTPYPITTLQRAHQIAGHLIIQGIPEHFRPLLILTLFRALSQTEAHLTAQDLIQRLPPEVVLEAAEELTARMY